MSLQTRFVFKQGAIYGVGNVLTKFSGLLLIMLYMKFISATEFGAVALFETIFQFILLLSGLGVKGGFNRWYHDMSDGDDKKALFFTTWSFNFASSFMAVTLVALLLWFFAFDVFKMELPRGVLTYFLVGTFFRLLYDVPFYLLRLEQKAREQTLWLGLNLLLLLGFSFYFLWYRQSGWTGIYAAQMWAHLLTFLAMLPFIVRRMKPKFLMPQLREMLRYGLPLAVSNVLTVLLTLSDRHIINQYQNLDEVAGYSMAFKVANLLQMVVVVSLITSYTNYFFKTMNRPGSMQFFASFTRLYLLLLALASLALVLFAPELIFLLSFGSEFFQASVVLVPVLLVGLIFSGYRQLLVLPLNKHKRSKRISLILIFSALINLAGNFWLVPLYGKMGASWATLMAQVVAMLWFIYEVRRCEAVNLQTGKSLLLFGVWLAMVALSSFVADLSFWAGLLMKGGVLSLFLLLLWFLRLVGPEDWTAALRFFRKE